ncbi:flavodoxin-dependent (E)-4-hydroxy-3-methylbut-2-enyl-diphosphate synthase [Ruminiclostridium cellulolyticum]|uniref:4-hydroxy-3-methylbut-2-en-1-yl diphosphate synthase (flavodoxin) n=1 Tax=Ruminiclostridium cellulolyticum (strain ATCC 35319 / DSM 5812 / JCM 6584 / H10) TaxID=394503 RepID=ISPG_RUMCH|nr:flavodoxin-dependent (E)-4-hydroxy-3-methylbut-2-enyl-diphosphate synthase [Ruminiclostridium cellulolyticum]B8I6E1.1 RecName: Full=4-hydroxy-3-methylbut-2-en-1-yl diphosphate synthase (flavodoxin); AltName: Full=1-hydroxy-2-methyl-2-(E)-butenyl 4-diphosphate synthase [Ruminiclostridium cellulolyticum H10]ACL74833.1 1-hydroxy-2-methyl-2-(E)-butenyl 4-diphosphate synthase [Ruminiclostridium cellulolyticum H10]
MEDCIKRNQTKKIKVGDIFIGGDSPISVQSMTNTDTRDVKATIHQIKSLEEAGCDIVRLAILDNEAATAIGEIKKHVKIPLVADIHYDYRLAVECMKNGVDKIRLNPGNIGGNDRVRTVAGMAKERGIPIRIGVNSGSVEKRILEKFGGVTAEGMVESALAHVAMLENVDFNDIAISIKASSVPMTIAAYRLLSEKCLYPLHVGVTEAGTVYKGTIKSAVGIGCLLAEGIGDTIRVSLTGDPVEEIKVGKQILKSLDLLKEGIEIVSCPTCGRTQVNLIDIANSIEPLLEKLNKNIKVAIMGCAVNGPGEAKDADIGIAGGVNEVLLFKKGRIIRKIPQENVVEELIKEISEM